MVDPLPKLRVLARVEVLRARIVARVLARRLVLYVVAAFVAAIGLACLGVAGFLALAALYGPVYGGLIMGGALIFAALVLVGLAAMAGGGTEAATVDELARVARAGVAADIAEVEASFKTLEGKVRGLVTLGTGPAGLAALVLAAVLAVSPELRALLRRARR